MMSASENKGLIGTYSLVKVVGTGMPIDDKIMTIHDSAPSLAPAS
jgi:hypothetical protein